MMSLFCTAGELPVCPSRPSVEFRALCGPILGHLPQLVQWKERQTESSTKVTNLCLKYGVLFGIVVSFFFFVCF